MTFRSMQPFISAASVTSAPVPAPPGTETGDLVWGAMSIDSGSATVSPPGDWTAHPKGQQQMSHDGHTVNCGYKFETGAPAATYTFTSTQSNDCVAFVCAHSNLNSASGLLANEAVTTGATGFPSPVSINIPTITPGAVGDIVGCAVVDWDATDNSTYTPPAGYSERVDIANGNLASITAFSKDNDAGGATGTLTAISTLAGASGACAGFSMAFAASGPTITVQPTQQVVYEGQQATFNVTAVAASGSLTYQWQRDDGSGFNDIGGATSNSYTTPATVYSTDSLDIYRVNVTDDVGTTTSKQVYLVVLMVGKVHYLKA